MERLSDFKPIAHLELPDLGEIDCSGLILVVGPNSSGKSQFLQDIFQRISGEPRKLVVARRLELAVPQYEPLIKALEREGYFESFEDESGARQLKPLTTYLGTGQPVGPIPISQGMTWLQSMPAPTASYRRRIDFLYYFGRLLVTALFLDRRLNAANQVGLIDFETQPPQADMHALYVDDTARKQLLNESLESFGKAVWPDTSRGNVLCLRVSDQGVLPTAEERLSPRAMSRFRTIETEGDGLKSYVATCIALLLGRRPVCVIDEPEMCLHPPQAYQLGRFIGRFGTSPDTVTLVATHSSHVLRGVIQTTSKVQIVRLTRRGGEFHAHMLPPQALADVLARPTVRAEAVLDGVFAQAVIVVEADSDRHVYQTVWETLVDDHHLDVHFAAVGGVGGIADTCRFYRTLRIPTAVIADLDVITDLRRLQRILDALTDDHDAKIAILQKAIDVLNLLRGLNPQISPDDVRTQLAEIGTLSMDWTKGDDDALGRRLRGVANRVDRLREIKRGGVTALAAEVARPVSALLEALSTVGLFVVPVGELEEWLKDFSIAISKENKWAWANEAARVVKEATVRDGDIWAFVKTIIGYLKARLEAFPTT